MEQEPITSTSPHKPAERGQALIEYALILVLVVMALVAAVAATGPALGNVFSNTVYNLVGITGTPQDLYSKGGPVAFWATVTYVAQNPPKARVFPTSVPLPDTPTPTNGPSPTAPTPTASATPKPTATLPPTPTATDAPFPYPHIDPIDQPVWWRVDSSVYLGGADWLGEYYPNKNLTAPVAQTLYNQQIDPAYRFNLNFNWGTGSPLDSWLTDGFSIRFTRNIDIQAGPNPVTLIFTLSADDGSRLKIDGTQVINNWGGSATSSYTQVFTPGTSHTIVVEYFDNTSTAKVSLAIATNKGSVAADFNKTGGAAPNCPWSQTSGTQPNTVSYAWKENLSTVGAGFPTNMHCNLELRGYVDLAGTTNPTMSFWDVWDFGTQTDTSVKLQLAQYAAYNADLSGGPNWAAGATFTLHTAGKNYAWTRNEFPVPASLLNKQVTWRFIMDSGTGTSGTNVRRWYLDDIRLGAPITTKTFSVCTVNKYTCGSFWDLDNTNQKQDFITTGRWDLTNRYAASNDSGGPSLSWDPSNGTNGNGSGNYVPFGSEQGTSDNRVHYVALNGKVDLSSIGADGNGGLPDWESDGGYPILSFYHAYGLDAGDSIEVQYTRDSDTPGTPAVWARVGTSAIKTSGGATITDAMKKYELQLKDIPNWNTAPFRLRFALTVNNSSGSTGWFIDNIAIEREGVLKYSDYPFCDDAENNGDNWLMGGQWGIASTTGAFQSGRSFSDSPVGNYVPNQVTSLSMRYAIDFNNDTPENVTIWGGNKNCLNGNSSPPSQHPVLSFWHWRKFGSSTSFNIEVFRSAHPTTSTTAIAPIAVWTYTDNGNSNRTQSVWEHEELDMRAAIEKATGLSWSALTNPAGPDKYDDDFYVQFTLNAAGNVADGVFIDNIDIKEYTESSFKLWSPSKNYTAKTNAPVAGTGNGTNWVDDIDNPDDWWTRWTNGGTWTGVSWDDHSGTNSMHDSGTLGQKYLNNSFNVLEMNKILDLRGTVDTDLPTMFFWTHYDISSNDSISVDVAVQDETEMTTIPAPRNTMGYDYQYLWGTSTSYAGGSGVTSWGGGSSWQSVWNSGLTTGQASRNDAWTRKQIDLRNFAGKRLKVRFVLTSLNSSGTALGWWLDDIQFIFRTNDVFTVGFSDKAQNMQNWIPEGKWGLAPDQWRGSGGGAADLGTSAWSVYWFDCINWTRNPTQPGPNASYLNQDYCDTGVWDNFFNKVTRTIAGTDAWIAARPSLVSGLHYIKDYTDAVNYDFGPDGRPGFASDTWYDYYGARFIRPITVTGGQYTFISTSDDGVRVKLETSIGAVPTGLSSGWNVINNWTLHGRTVNYQATALTAGNYNIIMEFLEASGDAVIQLTVGTNKFSFSDSPKAGATSGFPVVNSIIYSESSLLLNGVVNLNKPPGYTDPQWKPRLDYYEMFYFDSNTYGSVEVSADGGFSWVQTNLGTTSTCPSTLGTWQCDPNTNVPTQGIYNWTPSNNKDWLQRSHDLSYFIGQNIGMRFKLHTDSSTKDGWWITDILVGNAGS